jgi:hypothetical protein
MSGDRLGLLDAVTKRPLPASRVIGHWRQNGHWRARCSSVLHHHFWALWSSTFWASGSFRWFRPKTGGLACFSPMTWDGEDASGACVCCPDRTNHAVEVRNIHLGHTARRSRLRLI